MEEFIRNEIVPHRVTADRVAKKFNTEYNPGRGPDIITKDVIIEVETPTTVSDAGQQLNGRKGPVYIAGTNQEAVDKARQTILDELRGEGDGDD